MPNKIITVPDLGGAEDVEVIEILVSIGNIIQLDDSIATLESDKASMEVPSSFEGEVKAIYFSLGDKLNEGDKLIEIGVENTGEPVSTDSVTESITPSASASTTDKAPETPPIETTIAPSSHTSKSGSEPGSEPGSQLQSTPPHQVNTNNSNEIYAGPSVRKLARELEIDLKQVNATGSKGRLQKDDLHNFIKQQLAKAKQPPNTSSAIPKVSDIDYSKFGETTKEPLDKISRITAESMHRSWLNVPHVTQFDEASLSNLDTLRQGMKVEAEQKNIKLTPLAFLLKAAVISLQEHPKFNSALHSDGRHIIRKHYINIGVAVDTPKGLMVPVIRDADKKTIWQLAEEIIQLSSDAREGKIKPAQLQGGCFTLSSLGAMGGQGFTPIVNTPEVAILGISKAQIKPCWDGETFIPDNKLPLSLSYDHRAINGADAGKFMTFLIKTIENIQNI